MSNLVNWNVSSLKDEPVEELDDSMLPSDPPGYVPVGAAEEVVETSETETVVQPKNEEQEELDDAEILKNARLRLEKGRLYEMIMIQDIFQNMDADQQAIKSVQRELKIFAKDRMEVMLGMRQEKVVQENNSSSHFNNLEVEVLKSLAKKLSGGATETQTFVAKSKTLTPITNNSSKTTKTAVKAVSSKVISAKELASTVSPELASKKIEDMTYDEKIEYNRQKTALYDSRKTSNSQAIPMPSYDHMNAINSKGAGANIKTGFASLDRIAASMLSR